MKATQTNFHHGAPAGLTFDELVSVVSSADLTSPTCSTVPHLAYWKLAQERLDDLRTQLGVNLSDVAALCFEYPTASLPRCTSSMTDLMILQPTAAVAVEAKWTEGRYESVKTWKPKRKLGPEVLEHWLSKISGYVREPDSLVPSRFDECVYQMVHRTASACAAGRSKVHVLYQLFARRGERCYPEAEEDLAQLKDLIRPLESLSFWVQRIEVGPTEAYARVADAMNTARDDSGRDSPADRMRSALMEDEPLFNFSPAPPTLI